MTGFVSSQRFSRVVNLPVGLAQTELRAGKTLIVATVQLARFQRLELRSLTLGLCAVLTPGAVPVYINSALGLCSVGLYRGVMVTAPLALTYSLGSTTTVNPFSNCVVETPGTYSVIVSNNTNNTDVSVAVTGALKLFF